MGARIIARQGKHDDDGHNETCPQETDHTTHELLLEAGSVSKVMDPVSYTPMWGSRP